MIKALALDLDDTLIDTSQILVPLASQAAYQAMLSLGLKINFEDFDSERRLGALSMSHQKIFKVIAEKFSKKSIDEMAEAGIKAFYNPPIPSELALLEGAQENLNVLFKKYPLFLITSGSVPTQQRKIKATGAGTFFQKIYTLDGFKKERKRLAFQDILLNLSLKPEELLSIGNRLSQEIHDAKELGCLTCYFKYGEHVGEKARNDFEIPDFTVGHHRELIAVCRL
jgi:putative hydrolase of the HAD superfamily